MAGSVKSSIFLTFNTISTTQLYHRPLTDGRHLFASHNGYLYLAETVRNTAVFSLSYSVLGFWPQSSRWAYIPNYAREAYSPIYLSEEVELGGERTVFLLIDNHTFKVSIDTLLTEREGAIKPFPGPYRNVVMTDDSGSYHPTGLAVLQSNEGGKTSVRLFASMARYRLKNKPGQVGYMREIKLYASDLTGSGVWQSVPVSAKTRELGIDFKQSVTSGVWEVRAEKYNSGDIKSLCADSLRGELLFRGHHNNLMVIDKPDQDSGEQAPDHTGQQLYRLQRTEEVPHTDLMACYNGMLYLGRSYLR